MLRLATPRLSVDSLSHRRHKVRQRLVVRKILIFDRETSLFTLPAESYCKIGRAAVRLTP